MPDSTSNMTPEELDQWEAAQRAGIVYRAAPASASVVRHRERPPMTTRQGGKLRVLTVSDIAKLRRGESLD